ncbi:MAG: ECF transporter S component [Clostridia bacterium]|nr:ECF transporter S component [Clostridia bacterium]
MKNRLVYLVKISVLAVIASLIMLLEFPLPFAPPFYKLDLSEVAVLIAGFALGPVAGVLTELFKILINLLMDGTTTAFVGEAANFAIGVSFILPASLIYKYKKSLSGALIGMAAGTVSLVVIGALINYFVMIPAYSKFLIPMESIIAMGNSVNVGIDSLLTLVLFATVPFNLVKGLACSLITALVYKRISPLLKPKKQIASTNEAIK